MREFDAKLARIRALLLERSLDALLIQRADNFAWATCGASSYVNQAQTVGASSLLITRAEQHLITDNIEAPRLEHEEGLQAQEWQFHVSPWYEAASQVDALARGLRLASDSGFSGAAALSEDIVRLRSDLTPEETDRFRILGGACAQAMDSATRGIRPGMTELEIAGILDREVRGLDVQPIVNLIGTDERVYRYRHPLPTGKRLEQYGMLVLCGRRGGLVCSVTRFVHFGPLPDKLRRDSHAVALIDGHFMRATRPGASLADVFRAGVEAYALVGYPDEWKLHHQGGLAGYAPREIIATPASTERAKVGQAFAWNPSITGTKSEDTIIVGPRGTESITDIPDWPSIDVEIEGSAYRRPAVLEVT